MLAGDEVLNNLQCVILSMCVIPLNKGQQMIHLFDNITYYTLLHSTEEGNFKYIELKTNRQYFDTFQVKKIHNDKYLYYLQYHT